MQEIKIEFRHYDYLEEQTNVRIILDSYSNVTGARATTMLWHVPRFLLPQLNTHRVFSRNVSSSRAKRFRTLLRDATYKPSLWLENHKGMQADFLVDEWKTWFANAIWTSARYSAIVHGYLLDKLGISKQYSNRIIENFCYVDYLVTSTEWNNFFVQRDDNHAQFEIQVLARKAKDKLESSQPQILNKGNWHLPFVTSSDKVLSLFDRIRVSASRCARTSYGDNLTGASTLSEFRLYDKLVHSTPPHLSPVEHQLLANDVASSGNIQGFTQYRKLLEVNRFEEKYIREVMNEN